MLQNNVSRDNKLKRRLLSVITVLAMAVTTLVGSVAPVAASTADNKTPYTIQLNSSSSSGTSQDNGPTEKMSDGAILHAWCWSFNTIKNNMKAIRDAGYTSVQTSPANTCVVGNGGDLKFTNQWWYHYQPTDYKIGNYQLGTESEFKAMCAEAKKYGIRIIVDVVANHCTSDYSKISNDIKSISNFFHTNQEISNWGSRYEVTQKALLGMYDNNTQNKTVQNYILKYTKQCIADGASGFRYDAAKHIELPDDPGYGGDFWPTVLNNGAEFQYGEILQDSISRESAYANYMSVTASAYGIKLRNAIGSNNFNVNTISGYENSVSADKLVTWVESHDNYANAISDYGSSEWMNDEQVKLTWAVIAARKGGTPLFFSRPVGGGGQTWDNRFPEKTKIGDRGSDLFMDDEVAAVNKFRNAMVGENEYLRNPNGDSKVLMIERGTKGVAIINLNYNDYALSSTTNLAAGTYTNQTDNNNKFTVANGKITGTLPSRSVVVLYNYNPDAPSVSINNCPSVFKTDSTTLTLSSENTVHATYAVNGGRSYLYDNGDTITIGAGDAYGTTYSIELRGINKNGDTTSQTYTITKKDPNASTNVYFEKPSGWGSTVYAYLYDKSTSSYTAPAWPGTKMTADSNGYYKFSYSDDLVQPRIIFTDGTKQTPAAQKEGYKIVDNGIYSENGYTGNVITPSVAPSPSTSVSPTPSPSASVVPSTDATIYFTKPSNWSSNVYAYVYDEKSSLTVKMNAAWPGVKMNQESNGEYSYTVKNYTANDRVIFTDGSNQTPSSSKEGYTITKDGHYTVNGLTTTVDGTKITIYYATNWSTANIHYQIGSGSWTAVPGAAMSASPVSGYKTVTIDLGTSSTLTACFNNGNGNWDNNSGNNYSFTSAGTYTVKNGTISSGSPN